MNYIKKKYAGYSMVSVESLKTELLLSQGEFVLIRKEVAATLGKHGCPKEISFDLFNSLVDLHL